jgi:hypothetical protein
VLVIDAATLGARFQGTVSDDVSTIAGTWTQGGQSLPLTLTAPNRPRPVAAASPQPSVASAAPPAPGPAPASASAPPPTQAQAPAGPASSQLAKDPRLNSLSPEVRSHALAEADEMYQYCEMNVNLVNFYDCGCFSRKMFDGRLAAGFEVILHDELGKPLRLQPGQHPPFKVILPVELMSRKIDIRDCIAPEKIEKYGSEMTSRAIAISRDSPERKAEIAACAGRALAVKYRDNPMLEMNVIHHMLNQATTACRGQKP